MSEWQIDSNFLIFILGTIQSNLKEAIIGDRVLTFEKGYLNDLSLTGGAAGAAV